MLEFTIFTCTYQNAHYIKRCYYSILSQNIINWEWLIIDDGSTDLTEQVLTELNDTRIVYHKLINNQGRGKARNYGLQFIRGEWVVILDMDDLMMPRRLDFARIAKTSGYDFLVSEVALISNKLLCIGIRPSVYRRGLKIFTHASLCCRSELFTKIGYFNTRYSEDQLMIVSLASKKNYLVVNEPLYLYQENASQNIKGAQTANITAFKLLVNFIIKKPYYFSFKMCYYILGFLVKFSGILISSFFVKDYNYFISKRLKNKNDIYKINEVNLFLNKYKSFY